MQSIMDFMDVSLSSEDDDGDNEKSSRLSTCSSTVSRRSQRISEAKNRKQQQQQQKSPKKSSLKLRIEEQIMEKYAGVIRPCSVHVSRLTDVDIRSTKARLKKLSADSDSCNDDEQIKRLMNLKSIYNPSGEGRKSTVKTALAEGPITRQRRKTSIDDDEQMFPDEDTNSSDEGKSLELALKAIDEVKSSGEERLLAMMNENGSVIDSSDDDASYSSDDEKDATLRDSESVEKKRGKNDEEPKKNAAKSSYETVCPQFTLRGMFGPDSSTVAAKSEKKSPSTGFVFILN